MPARIHPRETATVVVQHDTASDFLALAGPTLARHEASSNIVLAHAVKRVDPATFQLCADASPAFPDASSMQPRRTEGAFWLTLWSADAGTPALDLVLACVDGTLGQYPIFLWSPRRAHEQSSAWLRPRLAALADHLRACVPPERVFSVFGMTSLVAPFARRWSQLTGFPVEPEPFYAAHFSFCTRRTLRRASAPLPAGHLLRPATPRDREQVAQLCKEFADDSIHFPLSLERARVEAHELIARQQIWVYDADGAVGTICAYTRNTARVSAITKVYTTPRARRRGCAELLVRRVTSHLLDGGKETVVLYVGHENSAQKVYHRVGFAGLCGDEKVDGVEDSLELGFVGSTRGHW
ncbi:hypothetical protein PHLGIDRAFT_155592 [Phlebiopsis gigantea 11061_1 CR5-6]|uniref:N-acetyltransferase domain-containing protein n=1 Tax=Phlebiopsis gigantea (strain 11061_1 CR5-6) TaxID=745531 RepID=A0A0C3SCP1_PHLG1|nr:hypothetical protein PHLGIDRAFT_155592 [Phlebiopsis gigantea 11061_1 CR5-6]